MNFRFRIAAWACLVGMVMGGIPASAQTGSQEDPAAKLPEGEGKGYVQTLCTTCHGLEIIVSQRRDKQSWTATVYENLDRISPGMEREAEIIAEYLGAHFSTPGAAAGESKAVPAEQGVVSKGSAMALTPVPRFAHQVLFKFKPEVTEEQIAAVLESGKRALEGLPMVITVVVGKVVSENAEFPYGLSTTFRSREEREAYRTHPDHRKWADEIFRPLVAKSVVTDIEARE